jgi:hypothetical protein
MKASIGRTVIVQGLNSNGATEQAALVTRVWSNKDTADEPVMVNLTVFPDCATPRSQGSVMLYDTKALAVAAQTSATHLVAHWPDRV